MRKIMILSFSIVLVVALVALAFAFGEKEVPETDTSSSSQSKLIYSTSNSHSSQGNQEIDAMAEEEKKKFIMCGNTRAISGYLKERSKFLFKNWMWKFLAFPKQTSCCLQKA